MSIGAARALLALGMLLAACAPTPERPAQPAARATPEVPAQPAARATPEVPAQPVVRATAEGAGNSVEVAVAGRAVALDVWSNRGIGGATVELAGGPAPTSVELRLHLRAMEELRVTYDQGAIVASIASGPGHAVSQRRVAPDGAEQPLDPTSPGWLPIRVVAPEPDPPFPMRDGHIAVTLPADVMAGGERAFSIQWVDFFR